MITLTMCVKSSTNLGTLRQQFIQPNGQTFWSNFLIMLSATKKILIQSWKSETPPIFRDTLRDTADIDRAGVFQKNLLTNYQSDRKVILNLFWSCILTITVVLWTLLIQVIMYPSLYVSLWPLFSWFCVPLSFRSEKTINKWLKQMIASIDTCPNTGRCYDLYTNTRVWYMLQTIQEVFTFY